MFIRLEVFGRYLELGRIKPDGDNNGDIIDLVSDHPRPIEQYVGFQPLVTLPDPEDLHPGPTVPTR